MLNILTRIIATVFYIGYLPVMPGTFASIFTLAIIYFIRDNSFILILVTLVVMLLGFLFSGRSERIFNRKDPSQVVIDESTGMLLALWFLPLSLGVMLTALVLFRILDIFKPYPIKNIQNLKGSLGIMGDDIFSGVCANLILQLVLKLASLRGA